MLTFFFLSLLKFADLCIPLIVVILLRQKDSLFLPALFYVKCVRIHSQSVYLKSVSYRIYTRITKKLIYYETHDSYATVTEVVSEAYEDLHKSPQVVGKHISRAASQFFASSSSSDPPGQSLQHFVLVLHLQLHTLLKGYENIGINPKISNW